MAIAMHSPTILRDDDENNHYLARANAREDNVNFDDLTATPLGS